MFKNSQIYRLPAAWQFTAEQMMSALAANRFTSASSNELLRQGWTPPRGTGPAAPLVHVVNGQWLLQLQCEKALMPATVVNQVTQERAAVLEDEQGFAPGKKAMKELKERVADELLPQAFRIKNTMHIWIDPVHGWLVVDAASPAKADEAIKLLLKAVDRMPLESLRVQRSPVGVMTEWLQTDEAPAGFTVDQDAIMRATGESKAQVAYKRHTLEADEVRRHIAAGKQCTRLAMTWESKISFVLDESLAIKSIKPLDVLKESESITRNDDERFDGDFALMTGELAKMLADVVEALGGEADGEAPVVRPAARAAGAGQQKLERAVGLSAELYQLRARHRDVLNELYEQTVLPVIKRLREQMLATGDTPIKCAIDLAKLLPAGSSAGDMLLVAAVEMLEPSGALIPAASDVPAGDGSASDPLYEQAVAVVRTNQRASISLVQRHLRIGYNRAARLLEAMEGTVVGPMQSNGNREVLSTLGLAS